MAAWAPWLCCEPGSLWYLARRSGHVTDGHALLPCSSVALWPCGAADEQGSRRHVAATTGHVKGL